ncbi:MAG: hypothetical protein ACN4GM_02285 [Gammaproteobacteria bacterium]
MGDEAIIHLANLERAQQQMHGFAMLGRVVVTETPVTDRLMGIKTMFGNDCYARLNLN